MLYKAIYSPGFPFFALSIANALENGKAIISPKVMSSIPIIKTPAHVVIFKTRKLNPVKRAPVSINPDFVNLEFSNHFINGISNTKIKNPFRPNKIPISSSLK